LLKGDLNAVVGCTFLIGVFFVASNMVTENLFRVVDARTRP
jgi:peptide/nickel transport system permease protein